MRPACPKCGSHDVAEILWGYPLPTDEEWDATERGELVFGGCILPEGKLPRWRCGGCGHEWGRGRMTGAAAWGR